MLPQPGSMSTSSITKQRKEAPNPAIDSAAVDDEATFSKPLDNIGVAQAVANVPAHSKGDDVVRKAMVRKGTRRTGSEATSAIIATPSLPTKSRLSVFPSSLTVASNARHDHLLVVDLR